MVKFKQRLNGAEQILENSQLGETVSAWVWRQENAHGDPGAVRWSVWLKQSEQGWEQGSHRGQSKGHCLGLASQGKALWCHLDWNSVEGFSRELKWSGLFNILVITMQSDKGRVGSNTRGGSWGLNQSDESRVEKRSNSLCMFKEWWLHLLMNWLWDGKKGKY